MKVQSRLIALTVAVLAILVLPNHALAKGPIKGEISRVVDTSHLEFEGLKSWNYELRRVDKNKIVISVPAFDTATEAKLGAYSDPFIKNITVKKGGADNTYEVTFELAESAIESFDYLTDEPSRLIVDFYKKTGEKEVAPAVADKSPDKKESEAKKPSKTAAHKAKPGKKRAPASDEILQVEAPAEPQPDTSLELRFGAFDAGDPNYDRFRVKDYEISEDAIIASGRNIYLQFPLLKMPLSHLDKILKDTPEYKIKENDNDENKEARLLEVLYRRGRSYVFLKTFDYFVKKYPESKYIEILYNMQAEIRMNVWKASGKHEDYEVVRDAYVRLAQAYPDSPLAERNSLIVCYLNLGHGKALDTIQAFEAFIKKYPGSTEVSQIRKAIADTHLLLHGYDESLKLYNAIAKDYEKTQDGAEAKYRLGDVDFERENWAGAIQQYQKALKELPQFEKIFPNAHFNMAEALFWNKDYKNSLNEYINFIASFPTNQYGGYAMTRIGEIMGILGVDARRPMGAFLESSFRYPENPGAKIARLRMLTQQMKSMRPKDLKKALDEIKDSINVVHLPGIEEYSTLLLSQGLLERGEYNQSLTWLTDYYREHPLLKNKAQFTSVIMRSIASQIKSELDHGGFNNALKFEAKYKNNWLQARNRLDIPYLEARAYEQAGVHDEAEKLYNNVSDQLSKIAGSREERERRVAEFLPTRSQLELRMAAIAVEKRKFVEAYQHLKDIDKITDLTEHEAVERVQLMSEVSEFRGELDKAKAALSNLIKNWKGESEELHPAIIHLAELNVKTKTFDTVEPSLDRVLEVKELQDDLRAKALHTKADGLLSQGRTMAAIEVYQSLLEQYEGKRPLGSVRYKVGQLLFDRGDVKGAEIVWGKLQGGANDVLWDLAKEKLAHGKWQDDYRKYVKRIPAMSTAPKTEEKSQ